MAVAIQIVVHIDKTDEGARHVARVLEVQGYETQTDRFVTQSLYQA
jgi:Flp pilus assembly CpaF family ATPase